MLALKEHASYPNQYKKNIRTEKEPTSKYGTFTYSFFYMLNFTVPKLVNEITLTTKFLLVSPLSTVFLISLVTQVVR